MDKIPFILIVTIFGTVMAWLGYKMNKQKLINEAQDAGF